MVDLDRLSAAYETARCDLLAESQPAGHWIGKLSSSALSTATAISALALYERHQSAAGAGTTGWVDQPQLSELIMVSIRWLARHQNADGGWGDTDKSLSNIATTMLVRSAFALTAVPADCPGLLERADAYIAAQDGVRGVKRRYGRDRTFSVPILTNCALASLVPWTCVPALPFELACFPQHWWNKLRMPVVSYAIPALVAIGQARYFHARPWNPLTRLVRHLARDKSLRVLGELQPASGGFLEAAPLTAFVVMSLVSSGQAHHPVARKGVDFLVASVRPDGSWPIDTNLATWNTTLSINALAGAGEDVRELGCLDWLLACQQKTVHPYTGAASGGWAWTDRSGGVPDADDTSGALLSLAAYWQAGCDEEAKVKIHASAAAGIGWLLDLQNSDGGWPTFCRGWGKLPFDRSGSDLTAHVLRACHAWRAVLVNDATLSVEARQTLDRRIATAIESGFRYLLAQQHPDGYWVPLWFGNQHRPDEDNPLYGTAKVLAAFRDLGRQNQPAVRRALDWLLMMQHADGCWGGKVGGDATAASGQGSVEETALVTEILLTCGQGPAHESVAEQGLTWLVDAVEANRHTNSSPIGFYFAKLWYYEKLYPLIASVAALGQAVRRRLPRGAPSSVVHTVKT